MTDNKNITTPATSSAYDWNESDAILKRLMDDYTAELEYADEIDREAARMFGPEIGAFLECRPQFEAQWAVVIPAKGLYQTFTTLEKAEAFALPLVHRVHVTDMHGYKHSFKGELPY